MPKAKAPTFPDPDHDHAPCRTEALDKAERLCRTTGKKLTNIRRRVLETVWESHRPIGAYDILAKLNQDGGRTAPIIIYRALEFLMDNGLVHRLASLNAFIGCSHPEHDHAAGFLICKECGSTVEIESKKLNDALASSVAARGFAVDTQVVELRGLCPHCNRQRAYAQ
ncbi:MAG: Fur family transcriptional regulator [Candidatus Marinimicrobia bacterium]|nr:Fur family transcriptional regulator [Candidatus Neomarinimicrobiota bacterium]